MAFVLPNGTVVDPDRDDRDRIMAAISERRRLAAQSKNQERQSQMQASLLAQEMESERASREQDASLTREEMAQRERMARSSDAALDARLQGQFDREQASLREQNLAVVDEEESLASGIAKRINDQMALLGPPPDPVKNAAGFGEWQSKWQRIRSQVPSNLESALMDNGGKWQVNPDYFRIKRARWSTPKRNEIAAAISSGPTDESIVRGMVRNASPVVGRPVPSPVVVTEPQPNQGIPPQIQAIASAIASQPQQFAMPSMPQAGGIPPSWMGPMAPYQQPFQNPIAQARVSIAEALSRLLGNARWGTAPMMPPSYQAGLPAEISPSMLDIGDGLRLRGVTTWP